MTMAVGLSARFAAALIAAVLLTTAPLAAADHGGEDPTCAGGSDASDEWPTANPLVQGIDCEGLLQADGADEHDWYQVEALLLEDSPSGLGTTDTLSVRMCASGSVARWIDVEIWYVDRVSAVLSGTIGSDPRQFRDSGSAHATSGECSEWVRDTQSVTGTGTTGGSWYIHVDSSDGSCCFPDAVSYTLQLR